MKRIRHYLITLLVVLTFVFLVSCGGDASSSPSVVEKAKAFSIGDSLFDTLQQAVSFIASNVSSKVVSYTIHLNYDFTDDGAEIPNLLGSLILDFGNYTYTLSNGSKGIVINNPSGTTIQNGSITVASGASLADGTKAVITTQTGLSVSDIKLNLEGSSENGIEASAGTVELSGATEITTKGDKKTIVATDNAQVTVSAQSSVVLTGSLKMQDKASVNLGNAIVNLTSAIEKEDDSIFSIDDSNNIKPVEGLSEEEYQGVIISIGDALHIHSFVLDSEKSTDGSCTEDSRIYSVCSECGSIKEVIIPAPGHTFSEEWTTDETHHWHAATCGHDVVSEKTEHNFGIDAKCTVCGVLSKDAVTVSFDANGGNGSMADITVIKGAEVLLSSSFSAPAEMVFTGWNTMADGTGDSYKDGGVFTVSSNITLYAQWKEYSFEDIPLTLEFIDSGTLSFKNPRDSLQYSKNGGEITAVSGDIAVAAGDVICLYAEAKKQTYSKHLTIKCSSDCYVYGNVMSLLSSQDYATDTDISVEYALCGLFEFNLYIKNHIEKELVLPATELASYCYCEMFCGCQGLTVAPALPSKVLSEGCYEGMFAVCTGLTVGPELPATELATSCYKDMFYYCKGLATAPILPAMTLAPNCYRGMFYDCSGLTVPPELPATTLTESCYGDMFRGCKKLAAAPTLPAMELANGCYYFMFSGCTGLTSAPELPATTLKSSCYSQMFSGCTGLTTAPLLPATKLKDSCYEYMFSGCTGLTSAPELPATTLANYCYRDMFSDCTGLTSAPELPAMILADHCYFCMFSGCTRISAAPELPATTLVSYCYSGMFEDCLEMVAGPELPATTLKDNCYKNMFYGCKNLSSIMCLATNLEASGCTSNWLYGVASNGTFKKAPRMNDWSMGSDGIPYGWTVVNYDIPLTLEFIESGTISFVNPRDSLQYSKNGGEKTAVSGDVVVKAGDIISLYAEAENQTSSNYLNIRCTSDCYVYGNLMSLLDSESFATDVDISVNRAMYGLFKDNTHIKNHSTKKLTLPATTLESGCYEYLFYGCTGLTVAPELPATSLASDCYYAMFRGCTGLTVAPNLPAKTLASRCYDYMFCGCTGLISTPELPATTLEKSCYYSMFSGCTGLTTAPELPAIRLANDCYGLMFQGCTGLTSAPELPATTLKSSCYSQLFSGCTGLTSAPELPSMTLADWCYHYMFFGCTGLTSAPVLPAITLSDGCYREMFYGCTNLGSITCLARNISADSCTFAWLSNVASNGTFIKDPTMNNWGTGSSGIPSGWNVVNKEQ